MDIFAITIFLAYTIYTTYKLSYIFICPESI